MLNIEPYNYAECCYENKAAQKLIAAQLAGD
jgi:hypothetical protein